jgi:hypothetical protein
VEDSQTNDVADEVIADVVNISQGGAGRIEGGTIRIDQGGAQTITGQSVEVTQGGAVVVSAETATLNNSAVAFLIAEEAKVVESIPLVAVTNQLSAENSRIGVLLAGRIDGEPEIGIDLRMAAAIGAGAAIALFILRRIFRS